VVLGTFREEKKRLYPFFRGGRRQQPLHRFQTGEKKEKRLASLIRGEEKRKGEGKSSTMLFGEPVRGGGNFSTHTRKRRSAGDDRCMGAKRGKKGGGGAFKFLFIGEKKRDQASVDGRRSIGRAPKPGRQGEEERGGGVYHFRKSQRSTAETFFRETSELVFQPAEIENGRKSSLYQPKGGGETTIEHIKTIWRRRM